MACLAGNQQCGEFVRDAAFLCHRYGLYSIWTDGVHLASRAELAKELTGPWCLNASNDVSRTVHWRGGADEIRVSGLVNSTSSTASKRNEVMAVVSCTSTVGW